jgi:HEAT repeat protein
MGFKADASFLRFLTMGALGVRETISHLREDGFEPIELERYCASNKIWATKVKRLRLPDVLCVRTGLRVEVRAKSELKIRMSDAPNNPDRRWDVGLRDDDVVAFVACDGGGESLRTAGPPVFFLVGDLRASVELTKLGPPKSASEGAERDREWKSTVPSQDGAILEVTADKIAVQLVSGRRQTYRLAGNHAYVHAGERFLGRSSIIAGVVPRIAPMADAKARLWSPLETLTERDPVDRYAAAKAIPHRDLGDAGREALLVAMQRETEKRVALEMAASAARLGAESGLEHVASMVAVHSAGDLRMEAVLILTELASAVSARELKRIATAEDFMGQELRQAATWGLGKAGCRAYAELVDLLGDQDDAVVMHAVAGFGSDTPENVVESLVGVLRLGTARERAAASEALRLVGSEVVLGALTEAARSRGEHRSWILATLGRLEPSLVRPKLAGDPLLAEVEPLLTLGPTENWLATAVAAADLRFLLQQDVFS